MTPVAFNSNNKVLGFARIVPADTAWVEYEFEPFVSQVTVRTLTGNVFVSQNAEGAFAAGTNNYNTIPANTPYVALFSRGDQPRINKLRLAHDLGAGGAIELEMIGGG